MTECPSVIAASDIKCGDDANGVGNCSKNTDNPTCNPE